MVVVVVVHWGIALFCHAPPSTAFRMACAMLRPSHFAACLCCPVHDHPAVLWRQPLRPVCRWKLHHHSMYVHPGHCECPRMVSFRMPTFAHAHTACPRLLRCWEQMPSTPACATMGCPMRYAVCASCCGNVPCVEAMCLVLWQCALRCGLTPCALRKGQVACVRAFVVVAPVACCSPSSRTWASCIPPSPSTPR